MKNLKEYLTEGYWTSTSTADHFQGNKQKPIKTNDKNIKDIVKQEIKKLGKDANLNHIDVSDVTNMNHLFTNLDPHKIDISGWDVSNVTSMRCMFYDCQDFNSDLSNWDVSNVKDMQEMFNMCRDFNSDLSNWDVSNVKNMKYMFRNCVSLKNKPSWYKEK